MYIIGVTGLSCSGKTTLSRKLQSRLGADKCLLLSMDDFYKPLTADQQLRMRTDDSVINFDTPDSIDYGLLNKTIGALKRGEANVPLPHFDVEKCTIASWTTLADASAYDYLIVEGLFVLSDDALVGALDLKLWLETSDYVCALRRFMKFSRLLKSYTHDYIYNQCIRYVIPGQERFIKPYKRNCDFFVNGEIEDTGCVNMIVNYIRQPIK